MKCKVDSSSRILFGTLNTVLFACGFFEVVCGFLLLCDSKRILLSRLLASPESGLDQPPFYYLALALLAAGLAICGTSAMGCWATYVPGYAILTVYFLVVLALVLGECVAGVVVTAWPQCAGVQRAAGWGGRGAVAALQAHYGAPDMEHFTASVDLAQTELQCCGITGARNYDMSVWQLRRLGPRGLAVPLSCCVPRSGAGGAGGSYLDPAPLNSSRCQEISPNPDFRFVPGCQDKLEDWYHQQYLALMLGLSMTTLLKLAILLSTVSACVRVKRRPAGGHSVSTRTIHSPNNENMASLHDEPISAKYIQPNNLYTPRARNPRIFPHKPNEMV